MIMAELAKGVRITGKARTALAAEVKRQYAKGIAIRTLAQTYGRSYGFIHTLLTESDVAIRSRGGRHALAAKQRRRA
jgi:hypothetical protein